MLTDSDLLSSSVTDFVTVLCFCSDIETDRLRQVAKGRI
jgi:hypothetical protein